MEKSLDILAKVETLFMNYGIKSVSMDDISRHLGMSKKTLYQMVENKADLIHKVIRAHLENEKSVIDEICDNSGDAIQEMLMIASHVSRQLRDTNPSTVYDMQKYYPKVWMDFESLHKEYIYGRINKNITNGIGEGIYRSNIDPDIIARFYVGKSFIMVDEQIFPSKEYDKEALFLEFITYHIHGIASQKGLDLLEKHLKSREQ